MRYLEHLIFAHQELGLATVNLCFHQQTLHSSKPTVTEIALAIRQNEMVPAYFGH